MSKNKQNAYTKDELLACSRGELFGLGNAQLPAPNMLMADRIISITATQGIYGKGEIIAELDIDPSLWFFDCHFKHDPVMPGCLGLDAMWQLVGFFMGWSEMPGRGRALGCGEVRFTGQVLPNIAKITYKISIKRLIQRKLILGVADGELYVADQKIYSAKDLRVGMFSPSQLKTFDNGA